MRCPKCGADNPEDAKFCSLCGFDDLIPMKCPVCSGAMKPGFIVPISPGHANGQLQWFEEKPDYVVFMGQGEALTRNPPFDVDPYGSRRAYRCLGCRIVSIRY